MIETYSADVTRNFKELIAIFNQLEKDLQYPNCENGADRQRVLQQAENQLIRKVYL